MMEKLNTDQVLNLVLIIITLGAVAWAALQNWFFTNRNRYQQFPPYYPPYGAYPPAYGTYPQQGAGDYPYPPQTPRSRSPILTLVVIVVLGIVLYKWAAGDEKPVPNKKQELPSDQNYGRSNPDQVGILSGAKDTVDPQYSDAYATPRTAPVPDSDTTVGPQTTPDAYAVERPAAVPETGFSVQVAALEDEAGFERLAADLRAQFPRATIFRHISEIESGVVGDKLLIGRFPTREKAMEGVKKLRRLGYDGCFPVSFEETEHVMVYQP